MTWTPLNEAFDEHEVARLYTVGRNPEVLHVIPVEELNTSVVDF